MKLKKEMEITTEIKAKVFAQYLLQKVKLTHIKKNHEQIFQLEPYVIEEMIESKGFDFKLILKPLSEITHEDCTELYAAIKYGMKSSKFILEILQALPYNAAIIAYQYLISKGYDLPNYLLGGKTLQECGLAIYEKS